MTSINRALVVEWDASSHAHAWDLFSKCIVSDGGATAQRYCEMSGEPLIEGMMVGTPKDLLTTAQTHQVGRSQVLWGHSELTCIPALCRQVRV